MFKYIGSICLFDTVVLLLILNYGQAKKITPKRVFRKCAYELKELWSRQVGHTPFVSSQLISDINVDGHDDIISTPFTDEVSVINVSNGKTVMHSPWPQVLPATSFHSGPLAYDISGDGSDDIILISTNGELIVFNGKGTQMQNFTYQIPGVYVRKDWFELSHEKPVGYLEINNYVVFNKPQEGFLHIDPHVLSTPLIVDLNVDNRMEELVIPVSYYYDAAEYSSEDHQYNNTDYVSGATRDDVTDSSPYDIVAAVVVVNLTTLTTRYITPLHLSKATDPYPAYLLFSPTVADVSGDSAGLEIVVGGASGWMYVLTAEGGFLPGFPVESDSIHAEVLAVDVDVDGDLELVLIDVSGHVVCYYGNGSVMWQIEVSGASEGAVADDVNNDGKLDLVFLTDSGDLYVLDALTGQAVSGWPMRVSIALVAATKPLLIRLHNHDYLDIVIVSSDDHLHIISGDGLCRRAMNVGESSVVSPLLAGPHHAHSEPNILIVTLDGSLMMVAPADDLSVEQTASEKPAQPSAVNRRHFVHANIRRGIAVEDVGGLVDYTGSMFDLRIHIYDDLHIQRGVTNLYTVSVYFGRQLLSTYIFTTDGLHTLSIPTPGTASVGHIHVRMCTQLGFCYSNTHTARFNLLFISELQWLLVCPFLVLVVFMLLLHGFPASDLLPVAFTGKTK